MRSRRRPIDQLRFLLALPFLLIVVVWLLALPFVLGGAIVSWLSGTPVDPSLAIAVAALLVVLIATLGAVRFLGRTGRTLDALVEAARRVEAGDYTVRLPAEARGPRPLRDLVRGFDTMVERLEVDDRQRRSLLADVSHELRTPLSIVRGNLEAILDGVHPADEVHLRALVDETTVIERLIEDLRTISLSEAGTLALHRESTDLDVLLADVAASFEPVAAAGGVSLEVAIDGELPLLDVDPIRIREVISNLVSNALRYTGNGSRIRLAGALEPGGESVRLAVSDSGTGIEPEALPYVFDRFAKSGDSRGSGLGLAIARSLVEAHGGTIEAASGPAGGIDGGSGTTFSVRLPVGEAG